MLSYLKAYIVAFMAFSYWSKQTIIGPVVQF